MSVPGGVNLAMLSLVGGAAPGGYEIERSLRFNSADSAYLSRTPASAGNRTTWTFSTWIKRSQLGVLQRFFSGATATNDNDWTAILFNASDQLVIGGYNTFFRTSNSVYRDCSAWYHLFITADLGNGTAALKLRAWINNVEITWASTSSNPTTTGINSANNHAIGAEQNPNNGGVANYFNGYLADVHFIDGQALAPTDFGEFDDNGVWQPIEYAGTYGTNGFHLDFSDNSTAAALGTDTSGNGNTWTVNNITASEYRVIDAPTLLNGAMIVRGVSGGSVTVTISGAGTKNYFTSSDGIDWTWQSSATSATYSANYIASGGAGTNSRIAVSNGAFQYAMWNTNTNFDSSSNTTTDTTGLTFTTATANGSNADSLFDSPTNGTQTDTGAGGEVSGNYATLNPLDNPYSIVLSNGNLDWEIAGTLFRSMRGNFMMTSGKWYFETRWNTGAPMIGIARPSDNMSSHLGSSTNSGIGSGANATYKDGIGNTSGVPSHSPGDILMCAFDADAGKVWFGANGSWYSSGDPVAGTNERYSGLTDGTWMPAVTAYDSSGNPASINFGQRPFAYTAPSGYKALCTTNLPDPTIADGTDYMDAALYTGNGTTQTISGLGFSPDLVWTKARSAANSHALWDTVRGVEKRLISNATDAEATRAGGLTAFTSDGFTHGDDSTGNASSTTYVAWTWDAGTSTVSNTDGSITSSVRANASAGFSVVTYTGTGSAATVGHGLGVAPSLLIVKQRNAVRGWSVYHKDIGASYYLELQRTDAKGGPYSGLWNDTAPTSTVFSILNDGGSNASGGTYVAYCFAPVEGYSAFGSYTGNGSADGPFVYCGFRPRFLLIKRTDTSGYPWVIVDAARDGYNLTYKWLEPNSSSAEQTTQPVADADFLSNGFKLRGNGNTTNQSSGTYIYFAVAESPFQYARAR